jgi:tetratricopeptide (TPR) repeat protein
MGYIEGHKLLFEEHKSEEALKYLELAVMHNPDVKCSLFDRAVAYYYVGNREKDIKKLERAQREMRAFQEIEPNNPMTAQYLRQVQDRIELIHKMRQKGVKL